MRKIIALLLVLIGFLFFLMKRGEQVALDSIPSDTLVVFSKTGCHHCHDAFAYINDSFKKQFPQLPILVLDVDYDNNLAKLFAVAKRYHIPEKKLGTPFLLYNGRFLIGWKPQYEKKLVAIIKKGSAKSQNKEP